MMKHIEQLCVQNEVYSIKIDTHEDNLLHEKIPWEMRFPILRHYLLGRRKQETGFEKLLKLV